MSVTGQLYIVAAPSGGGKTSLVQALVRDIDQLEISVSHTTRDQRPGEIDGEHYYFVSDAAFMKMVKAGEFIENAIVYDHHYGTSQAQIESRLSQGIDVVLDIDWQGAAQLKNRFSNAVSIFILPPTLAVLKQRLTERGRDHPEVIQGRMAKAHEEIQHFAEFDYLIINEDFSKALNELKSIIVASRLKASVQAQRHQQLLSLLIG